MSKRGQSYYQQYVSPLVPIEGVMMLGGLIGDSIIAAVEAIACLAEHHSSGELPHDFYIEVLAYVESAYALPADDEALYSSIVGRPLEGLMAEASGDTGLAVEISIKEWREFFSPVGLPEPPAWFRWWLQRYITSHAQPEPESQATVTGDPTSGMSAAALPQ